MICYLFIILHTRGSLASGYDSGADQATCGRPFRSGKMYQPPCDLEKQGFCTSAGKTYPWQAVRRFVKDNQGLMRRMYGDQRHSQVLRGEVPQDPEVWRPLEGSLRFSRYQHEEDIANDVFPFEEEGRGFKEDPNEDILNTKFVYAEEPIITIKLAGLKTAPHFRSTTEKLVVSKDASPTTKGYEETTAAASSDDVVTELVTEQTTQSSEFNNTDRIDDGDENSITTTIKADASKEKGAEGSLENEKDKIETMLFQDLDEDDQPKKKVHFNYEGKGVNACPVREEVVAPFWANNTRGEVLALLNMYPFEQYVHWEKCTFENRQMYCREGCRCEQQYRLHRLLAYDPNNECRGIFSDWFRFPSCCLCICYDMPVEFRVTSRSPRYRQDSDYN